MVCQAISEFAIGNYACQATKEETHAMAQLEVKEPRNELLLVETSQQSQNRAHKIAKPGQRFGLSPNHQSASKYSPKELQVFSSFLLVHSLAFPPFPLIRNDLAQSQFISRASGRKETG